MKIGHYIEFGTLPEEAVFCFENDVLIKRKGYCVRPPQDYNAIGTKDNSAWEFDDDDKVVYIGMNDEDSN